MNSRAWSRSPACSPSWKARPDICITAKPTGALWEANSRARTASRIRTGQRARPRRIVAELPDPEAGSLRVQLEGVGRRVGARVGDVLRRDEHPHAIRVDVGVQGELHPIERSADDLDPFTQGAIAVVGVV